MRIVDDFLDQAVFEQIQNQVMSSYFPWYYNSGVLGAADIGTNGPFQFIHRLYEETEGPLSQALQIFDPLFEKIGVETLIKAKLNLGTRDGEHIEGGWHTDYPKYRKHKTAVFYLNSNNGYTLFEDGTKVETIQNRFAEFDSNTNHTGVSQTDQQVRVVLNLNYLLAEEK